VAVLSSPDPTINAITGTMHIHPALTEVIQQACGNLMTPEEYRHVIVEMPGKR
jgi:hypothetical protein